MWVRVSIHGAHQKGDLRGEPLGTPANKETKRGNNTVIKDTRHINYCRQRWE